MPAQWYRDTFSSFTPSASFAYRWTDDAMTYVSYAEGFKGGGWNSHFNAVLTADAAGGAAEVRARKKRETIEIGAKLDLADNTLRLNVAVFTSDYTDMQLTYRGPAPAGVAPFITNAGKASIDGAEARAHVGADGGSGASKPAWAISMRRSTVWPTSRLRCCRRDCVAGNRAAVRARMAGARRHRVHRACGQSR